MLYSVLGEDEVDKDGIMGRNGVCGLKECCVDASLLLMGTAGIAGR